MHSWKTDWEDHLVTLGWASLVIITPILAIWGIISAILICLEIL